MASFCLRGLSLWDHSYCQNNQITTINVSILVITDHHRIHDYQDEQRWKMRLGVTEGKRAISWLCRRDFPNLRHSSPSSKLSALSIVIKIVIIFNCHQLSSSIVIKIVITVNCHHFISISNHRPHRPYLIIVIISSAANFHKFLRILQHAMFGC